MPAIVAARQDTIRRHNLSLLLDHIHRDGALTRAELTQRLRVSRSTMGALVAELLELGLVCETVPTGGSSVGRPSHVVGPHDAGPYVVAVDIDVPHVVTAAVGIGGATLARVLAPTPAGAGDPVSTARVAVESVAEVVRRCGRTHGPTSVGISVPGTVDRETGRVAVAPNLDWHDVEFGALMAELLSGAVSGNAQVHVGNDANLAVLAEHRRGNARGFDDVVCLLGRIGLGAGIIINGAPLRGHDGHAGEIGHNVIDSTGPPCHCGKRGCAETYVGDGALLSLAGRPLPPTDVAVAALYADAAAGDPVALAAARGIAEPLGRIIGSLVNTLNPQRVLLGGSLSALLDVARPEVEASVAHYTLEAPGGSVELIQPGFGTDAPLVGASEIAFADLLADPAATVWN